MQTTPFVEYLQTLHYDKKTSTDVHAQCGSFGQFTVPGREYNIGTADLPMKVFRESRLLDFSSLFSTLWDEQYTAPNILQRVEIFLRDKWDELAKYDLFLLPIDLKKKEQRQRCDLPNVTFALTMLMLKNNIEFVIVDPLYHGTDKTVRIVNFSAVLRHLQDHKYRVLSPPSFGPAEDALDMILYQRGAGIPDERNRRLIVAATHLKQDNIVQVRLTPGKYDTGGRPTTCYASFKESAALILHELSVVDPWVDKVEKRSLHKIFFVLDEFGAYAAYTAVAILGYGIDSTHSVLCYHRGVYNVM